ncbi:MAG: flagellar M-ring protein FliF [Gemmatimonadetes bacterium]|nr:flagellar M-ring protein FliF [Gemmatimonadota bacterium]
MPPALLALFDRVGGPRRAAILVIGLAAAAGVFGLARWASAPTWVPAFGSVPIGDVGTLTDRLTAAGIEFKLGAGGSTVLVKADEVPKARVALARAGVLPNDGRPGMEIFETSVFGETDREKQIKVQRALEGELERSIGGLRGIARARVHLVLGESDTYGVAPPPAEASIILEPNGSDGISPEVVRGIARTVANAVPGLTSDHVNISDDAGRTLNEGDEEGSISSLTSRQLTVQQEVEKNLRDKAERLLAPILGAGNSRVQVNASLTFDRIERQSRTFDPNRAAVTMETKSEVIPGTDGGAAEVKTGAEYDNTVSTENVSSAVGTIERLSVAVLLAAPVPPVADTATATAGIALAAPVDSAALRGQVETLVKSAVGYDEARGDVVTVTMLPFTPKPVLPVAPPLTTLEQIRTVQRPALSALGILLAFIIAMMTLRAASRPADSTAQLADGAMAGYLPPDPQANPAAYAAYQQQFQQQMQQQLQPPHAGGAHAPGQPHAVMPAAPRMAPQIIVPNNPMREQVLASVEQQPEVAAKLMRAWLRDG